MLNHQVERISPADAFEREAAMLAVVAQDPTARFIWFWDSPNALVTPKKLAAKTEFASASAASSKAGWPVFVRGTGGDVTPQGAGIVNVTHVYAAPPSVTFDLDREYGRLCGPIESALGNGASRGWSPGAFCDGAHNVQWQGKKFAGTAMRFRPCKTVSGRYAVMAHALMLMKPPGNDAIAAINRFLSDTNEDREVFSKAHTGLSTDTTQSDFIDRLFRAFADDPDLTVSFRPWNQAP